jgi:hypothetical protein
MRNGKFHAFDQEFGDNLNFLLRAEEVLDVEEDSRVDELQPTKKVSLSITRKFEILLRWSGRRVHSSIWPKLSQFFITDLSCPRRSRLRYPLIEKMVVERMKQIDQSSRSEKLSQSRDPSCPRRTKSSEIG